MCACARHIYIGGVYQVGSNLVWCNIGYSLESLLPLLDIAHHLEISRQRMKRPR